MNFNHLKYKCYLYLLHFEIEFQKFQDIKYAFSVVMNMELKSLYFHKNNMHKIDKYYRLIH